MVQVCTIFSGEEMRILFCVAVVFLTLANYASAQVEKWNFPDRKAVIVNNASGYIELTNFSFRNQFQGSSVRLFTDLGWKNSSSKPITAFEVVILEYDPFNRPISGGGRWLITGHNSGDWTPLMPGQSSRDGLIGFGTEAVLTSVVYVWAIRFQDGSVWSCDLGAVEKAIHEKLPVLKNLGEVNPPVSFPKKQ